VICIKKLFYLFLPLVGGTIIGILSSSSISYNNLIKPPLSPPGFIFPIVWSILYLLMGLSFLLYRKNNNDLKTIKTYYLQLIINYFWTIFFFVLNLRLFSIFYTIFLIILVVYLLILFYKQK